MGGSDTIRFVLDGDIIELKDVDPTRTVLQFLREDLCRTGTKEGCAEGDCGACTVVVAELCSDGDNLQLSAINSCIQFLPTLHGKELLTVESLKPTGAMLHPVQQAMVDHHASQCGFCTPGFVMALAALWLERDDASERDIEIAELNTRSYPAAHTGAPMFAVQMAIKIPAQAHISTLREEFLEFCDSINLDAIMEPVKS